MHVTVFAHDAKQAVSEARRVMAHWASDPAELVVMYEIEAAYLNGRPTRPVGPLPDKFHVSMQTHLHYHQDNEGAHPRIVAGETVTRFSVLFASHSAARWEVLVDLTDGGGMPVCTGHAPATK